MSIRSRNRAYAALKDHRRQIAALDAQLERDNARIFVAGRSPAMPTTSSTSE